jgi:outer membrane protein OmpA-like peptidoglycan-associated protein
MKTTTLLVLIFSIQSISLHSQLKIGNRKYDNLAYDKAIGKYQQVLDQDSSDIKTWARLGDCYRLTNDDINAEKAYSKVAASGKGPDICYLHYAEALMSNEKYDEAEKWLSKFSEVQPDDRRGQELKEGLNNIPIWKQSQNEYLVERTNISSPESDFAPVLYKDGIVFTSSRKSEANLIQRYQAWNGEIFYGLFFASGSGASLNNVSRFEPKLQTKYHDGPVCFNSNGTQMYFTRNNKARSQQKSTAAHTNRLKIFISTSENGIFSKEQPFPYNSESYSVCHPSLSADNQTLYFASDMPGGFGGMDIWKCSWNGTEWMQPVNMGATINTKGHEIFPTKGKNNPLYFSSNGHSGFGGLDLYEVKSDMSIANLGAPFNTSDDDFGMAILPDGNSGYFSSNRKGQGKNDDIYFFHKICTPIDVIITDNETGLPLANTQITVMEDGMKREEVTTNESGEFTSCVDPKKNYEFIAAKQQYNTNSLKLTSAELTANSQAIKIPLNKVPSAVITVSGRVQGNSGPISGEEILLEATDGTMRKTTTDNLGYYEFKNVESDKQYKVRCSQQNCTEAVESFSTSGIVGNRTLEFNLTPMCKGDIIRIENIYYEYNKHFIRNDAAIELDKVILLLRTYPSMVIELRSHTDARGSDSYNMKLSDQRAGAAVEYMIKNGIDTKRLVAQGYGETQLINECKNGFTCDDKTHEQNRRTEFKILSL